LTLAPNLDGVERFGLPQYIARGVGREIVLAVYSADAPDGALCIKHHAVVAHGFDPPFRTASARLLCDLPKSSSVK
jgi:hypothetical protein